MAQTAENYVSQNTAASFRNQAIKVWAATSLIVLAWVGAIVAAPLLSAGGLETASAAIYKFFSYICHQIPERSLHAGAQQLAVCSRCFGVYFGLITGLIAYPLWRPLENIEPLPRIWLFLSMVPIALDWSLTVFGIWENNHLSRLLTGMILGTACAVYIVPAIVEIVRHLMPIRHRPHAGLN